VSVEISWLLGWFSCVICLVFTLRCAFVFAKHEPTIFLALTVYAAQWGVLIVFYGEPKLNEFLPALSGYLCAIVGSIVYRHCLKRRQELRHYILRREGVFAYLLILVALPEALQTPYGSLLPHSISHEDVEVIVTLLLKSVGFYSLYKAVEVSCVKPRQRYVVVGPLAAYWVLEAAYTFRWLFNRHFLEDEGGAMSPFFLYGFSLVKLATAFTFIPSILLPYEPFSESTFMDRLLLFFHIEAGGKRRGRRRGGEPDHRNVEAPNPGHAGNE
jgi:hypothetical protein